MKKAFIIHGAYGNPEENWIPWLKEKLTERGYSVIIPNFPTPENQNLKEWMEIIEPYIKDFNKETILIGHSIGATFLLSILEKICVRINKTILVSGFIGLLGNKDFDSINKTFAEKEFEWDVIKNNSQEFYIFHGDNDPYVPKNKANDLGNYLGVKPVFIKNGGHLNSDSGFTKFDELINTCLL